MADLRIGGRPFAQQVAFFQRKVSVPTGGWWDLQRADHAHGFMVAGAFKAELLADLRGIVQGAIERGTPIDKFRKEFDAIVQKHGWAYRGGRNWRTRIIYETNIRQSYNAGRWQQLTSPAMRQARPYLQYRHNDKGRSKDPRPLHVSWNGTVLRSDDPWWNTHAPMNGWGCKCGIRALSEADLKRMGKAGPDAAPNDGSYTWTAPDGSTHEIPNGVDPGFDYNVGAQARSLPAAQRFGERVMQLPPAWRDRALADAGRHARDLHADVSAWMGALLDGKGLPSGEVAAVGMLPAPVIAHLQARGGAPRSAMIAASQQDMAEIAKTAGVDASLLRSLPAALASAESIVLERSSGQLLFLWRSAGGWVQIAVRPDSGVNGITANWLTPRLTWRAYAVTGGGQGYELIAGEAPWQ